MTLGLVTGHAAALRAEREDRGAFSGQSRLSVKVEMEDANLPAARRDRRESGTHMRYGVETSAQNRPTSRARKMCRVPNCPHADLTNAPRYCIRHSICELHIKAMEVRSLNLAGFRTRSRMGGGV